jgi:hypothetical protein
MFNNQPKSTILYVDFPPHLFSMEVLNQHSIGRFHESLLDLWRNPIFLNMVDCHMEVQLSKLR